MRTLEEIIKGFEVCLSGGIPQRCIDCPYHGEGCSRGLMEDALEYLQDHEPRKPKIIEDGYSKGRDRAYCGGCGMAIRIGGPKLKYAKDRNKDYYCGYCGRAVNWND